MKKLIYLLPTAMLLFACSKNKDGGSAPPPVDEFQVSAQSLSIPPAPPLTRNQMKELKTILGGARLSPDGHALLVEERGSRRGGRQRDSETRGCKVQRPRGTSARPTTTTNGSIGGEGCAFDYTFSDSMTVQPVDSASSTATLHAQVRTLMTHRDNELVSRTGIVAIENRASLKGKIGDTAETMRMNLELDIVRDVTTVRNGKIPMMMRGVMVSDMRKADGIGNAEIRGYISIQTRFLTVIGVSLTATQQPLDLSRMVLTINGSPISQRELEEVIGFRIKLALPAQTGVTRLEMQNTLSALMLELLPLSED